MQYYWYTICLFKMEIKNIVAFLLYFMYVHVSILYNQGWKNPLVRSPYAVGCVEILTVSNVNY